MRWTSLRKVGMDVGCRVFVILLLLGLPSNRSHRTTSTNCNVSYTYHLRPANSATRWRATEGVEHRRGLWLG